jgi:hypothetical protein
MRKLKRSGIVALIAALALPPGCFASPMTPQLGSRLPGACELWIDGAHPDYRYVNWSQAGTEVLITFEKPGDRLELRCSFQSLSDHVPVVVELEVNGMLQSAAELKRLNDRISAAP